MTLPLPHTHPRRTLQFTLPDLNVTRAHLEATEGEGILALADADGDLETYVRRQADRIDGQAWKAGAPVPAGANGMTFFVADKKRLLDLLAAQKARQRLLFTALPAADGVTWKKGPFRYVEVPLEIPLAGTFRITFPPTTLPEITTRPHEVGTPFVLGPDGAMWAMCRRWDNFAKFATNSPSGVVDKQSFEFMRPDEDGPLQKIGPLGERLDVAESDTIVNVPFALALEYWQRYMAPVVIAEQAESVATDISLTPTASFAFVLPAMSPTQR